MAIPSTASNRNLTQTAELVANIRKLLSPYAEKKKDDFATILGLVDKIASSANTALTSGSGSSAPLLTPSSTSANSAPGSSSSSANSSTIPDELAYGYARGQFAPGTNLPVRIKWEDPHYVVQSSDMPHWDGRTPPGVSSGSVPFYSDSGYLLWLGLDGKIRGPSGFIEDNTLTTYLAQVNQVPVDTYLTTMREAIKTAERPATKAELYAMSLDATGGQYATYTPVVTPQAERAYAVKISRTSPFGYGVGQIVPGTGLPARLIPGGDPRRLITIEDMPQWDGRLPEHVPSGSVPFYSTNGALAWLALNGKVYNSRGMISDNATTTLWAEQNQMSVATFVAAVRMASAAAGRALTLAEVSSAELG